MISVSTGSDSELDREGWWWGVRSIRAARRDVDRHFARRICDGFDDQRRVGALRTVCQHRCDELARLMALISGSQSRTRSGGTLVVTVCFDGRTLVFRRAYPVANQRGRRWAGQRGDQDQGDKSHADILSHSLPSSLESTIARSQSGRDCSIISRNSGSPDERSRLA